MIYKEYPKAEYAHIGGSGTWGCNYPNDLHMDGVRVVEEGMQFETPYGITAPMKLIELDERVTADKKAHRMLYVAFHGWKCLAPSDMPAEQLFTVFSEAGVKYVITDGSGGSVNTLLDTGDIIIPDDVIDMTKRPSTAHLFTDKMIRMCEPMCPSLRRSLFENASKEYKRVFPRGVYYNSEPPKFETAAEIRMARMMGADITGHTISGEVSLARALGLCFGAIYIVSNYGEGIKREGWTSANMFEHYYDCGVRIGRAVVNTFLSLTPDEKLCNCENYVMPVPEDVDKKYRETT